MFPIKMFRKILTERGERTFRFSVHLTECGICFVPLRAFQAAHHLATSKFSMKDMLTRGRLE